MVSPQNHAQQNATRAGGHSFFPLIFEKGSGRGTALGDGHPIKIACFPRLEPGMIEVPAAFEPLQVHQVVVWRKLSDWRATTWVRVVVKLRSPDAPKTWNFSHCLNIFKLASSLSWPRWRSVAPSKWLITWIGRPGFRNQSGSITESRLKAWKACDC